MTINDQGEIVSGQETFQGLPGGPWREYDQVWRHQIICQLNSADSNPLMQGWHLNGIRQRINRFVDRRLQDVLVSSGVDTSQRGFVHLDFSKQNRVFDRLPPRKYSNVFFETDPDF